MCAARPHGPSGFSRARREVSVRGRVYSLGAATTGVASRAYTVVGVVAAAIGAGIAGRHVYIQNLPADQVPSCGPGLDYIMDAFPLMDALEMVFTGSGECAEVNWSFLGLSMPAWVLLWFIALAGLMIFANWSRVREV